MKKKVVSIILCLSMILGLLPPLTIPAAAADAPTYSPVTTDYAILNRFNYKNSSFYTDYVKGTDLFNAVGLFSGLFANTTYTRSSSTFRWSNFLMNGNEFTNYGRIAYAGQLQIGMSATLHNVFHRHGNWFRGADSLAYQYALLVSGYNDQVINGYDFCSAGTATQRMNDMEYFKVSPSNKMEIRTGVGRTYVDCNCGDCTIGGIVVAFADTQDPVVSKVYTCDANGNAVNKVKAGSDIYLRVVFGEPVRFADNTASAHSTLQATMSDNNVPFTGNLVALQNDYLMFKFSIPDTVTGNYTMTSVDLSSLFTAGSLVLVKNGAAISTGSYSGEGYTSSASLVTDIAGNPLYKSSSNNKFSISSSCYIDGEKPYVMGVTKTTQMNNSDIKAELAAADPTSAAENDNSDIYAGVGDSVTFAVTFNEKLNINGNCYSSNAFWGMTATLNVKKSGSSDYVTVRAASMSQESGGVNLQNGASQGGVTKVVFAPFILTSDMVCYGGGGAISVIGVTPYSNEVVIKDLCGNTYDDADNNWTTLNTNPCYLDVTPPTVTTSVAENGDGTYTPETVEKSGSVVTAFCFPVIIDDPTGVDSITGSFVWANLETGGGNYAFEYAVKAENAAPSSEDEWQSGATGQSYTFTQVSAGTYIYVRRVADVEYDLTNTAIQVKAKDYAGNSGTTSFKLNCAFDCVAPVPKLAGTNRNYDSGSSTGTFTASVTVTDKVDLAGISYLWITDGSVPAAETGDWNTLGFTASTTAAGKTAAVNVVQDGITSGAPFAATLYIKATDTSGNTSVTNLGDFSYDVSDPEHTLTYTGAKTAEAELSVSGLESGSTLAVMVKSPDSPGSDDTYYVSVISASDYNEDVLDNTSFEDLTNPYDWHKYAVSESGGVYSFTYLDDYDDYLYQIIYGHYYGELDVTVLSGNSGAFSFTTESGVNKLTTAGGGSYPAYAEEITLNAAPGLVYCYAGHYGETEVYGADIITTDKLDNCLTSNNQEYPLKTVSFDPDSSSDDMLSTLEGKTLTVDITNNIMSGWGVSDVDFENSYLSVILSYDENGAYKKEQVGGNIALSPQAHQDIVLPACDYPSGTYKIVLTLKAKASGATSTFEYSDGSIYVDATKASESFGFAGFYTTVFAPSYNIVTSGGHAQEKYTYYGPVYGAKDAEGNAYTQYSAGDETVYLPVNSGVSSDGTTAGSWIYFTADDVDVNSGDSYYGERAIKAWNATAGVDADTSKISSKAASTWLAAVGTDASASQYSRYFARFVDSTDDVVDAYGISNNEPYLPLIRNTLNTIAYQVMNANGTVSEVRYVYIYPVADTVSATVSTTPTNDFVKEGELTFTPAAGQSMLGVSLYAYDSMSESVYSFNSAAQDDDDEFTYDLNGNTYSLALTDGGIHDYYVYTVDSYGNYTLLGEHFWNWTDSGAPGFSSSSASVSGYENFTATIKISDNTIFHEHEQKLSLYFDSTYMAALNLNYSTDADTGAYTGDSFKLTLPMDHSVDAQTVWEASEANPYGIYRVDVQSYDSDSTITVYGVIKYDGTLSDGASVSHTMYVTFEDSFGYVSNAEDIVINASNTKPAYLSGEYKEHYSGYGSSAIMGLDATFNTLVTLPESIGTDSPSSYSTVKKCELPVFGDGTHTISFYDIFGTEWTQDITLENEFGNCSLTVSLSETDYTSEAVEITITADSPNTMNFSVYDSTGGGWNVIAYPTTSVTFTVSRNSRLGLVLHDNGERVDETLYVVNILDEAPAATLNWYFDEFLSNTLPDNVKVNANGVKETTGSVTVGYTTSRKVTPCEGTAATYTFRYLDGVTSYTFQYQDEAGNIGSVTADLAALNLALVAPPAPVVDITKPEYQIYIYGTHDGKEYSAGYFSSTSSTGTLSDAIAEAEYVQGYYFDVDVTEDSAYRLLLLSGAGADTSSVTYATPSAAVSGVTLSGRTIQVTSAAAFTVAVVDNAGNVNAFSLDLGAYLDNTKPTATVEKVYTGLYEVTAYIKLNDKNDTLADTGATTLLSPSGLSTVSDASTYNGWYYYVFTNNGTVTLTFRDGAGNKAAASITVDSLDTTAPTSTVSWSPYWYEEDDDDDDDDGKCDTASPPNHLTNSDVTATVRYSKTIRTVAAAISLDYFSTWTDVSDDTYDDYFTLNYGSDAATVTFHTGCVAVRLTATAPNGKTVTDTLYLDDMIDTTEPTVTQVVSYNYNTGYETGTPYSATITLMPDEDVYCSSIGTPRTVVSGGDELTATVYSAGLYYYHFTDLAGNTRTVTVLLDRDMDRTAPDISVVTGDDAITNADVAVSVSMDEAGTLTVNGTNHTVAKDEPVTVTIANNGSYGVTAVDLAGNRSTTAFVIGTIDKTEPAVYFSSSSVSVRQDSDASALTALLDAGCTATDNISASSAIGIAYDSSGVDLTKVGIYKVTYTATDEAGNQGTASRYVKVYSKDEIEVLLGGLKTENGGTTVLTSKTITVSVTNPLGDEPYTIYLRSGLKTAGQMKRNYTIIKPDLNSSFTVSSTGFYTLYIVTQSRQTYLTRIYIEP